MKVTEMVAKHPVVVFSKSWCPYCGQVKGLFKDLKVEAKVIELDELADGDAVQAALQAVTGMRTVPQVFVGKELIGGCDDTMEARYSNKLTEKLKAAGALTG